MFCTENELQKSTGKHTLWKAHKFRNRDLGPRGSMPGRQVTCRGPTPRQRGTDHKAWFLSPDTQRFITRHTKPGSYHQRHKKHPIGGRLMCVTYQGWGRDPCPPPSPPSALAAPCWQRSEVWG